MRLLQVNALAELGTVSCTCGLLLWRLRRRNSKMINCSYSMNTCAGHPSLPLGSPTWILWVSCLGHTVQLLLCSPYAVYSTGLPWPTELLEEVISIIKQHGRILDILLSTCSLLLRVLGQGGQGRGALPSQTLCLFSSFNFPPIPSICLSSLLFPFVPM